MTVNWDIDVASANGVQRIRHSTQNFLANGSQEAWTNGTTVPANAWTSGGGVTVARSTSATTGTYAAQLSFDATNTGEYYQVVGVAPNRVDYTYSCYVERTAGTGAARLVAQDANSPYTEYVSVTLPTGAGQQLGVLTVMPTGSTAMRFAVKSGSAATSTWLLDECQLQESKAVATTYQPLLLDDVSAQTVYGVKTLIAPTEIAPTYQGISGLSNVRFVGRKTTSGAPTSGSFLTGDMVIDGASPRRWWICTAGGTPGTWS